MAIDATNRLLIEEYIRYRSYRLKAKLVALRVVNELTGDATIPQIKNYVVDMTGIRSELVRIAALPGIAARARVEEQDETLDLVANHTGLVGSIDAFIAWVGANIPAETAYAPAQTAPVAVLAQAVFDRVV